MVCASASYTGIRWNQHDWKNWSERVRRNLDAYFIPSLNSNLASRASPAPLPPPLGLAQLARVALDATDTGMSLHAIGSGWSFDDAAIGDQWTIDVQGLGSRLYATVGEALVRNSPPGMTVNGPGLTDQWRRRQADRDGTRKLVHVEAGVKLWQLIQMLDATGLALPTLGGSNGQALAGVVNTSVHGGDWNQPAFPGVVRALHIVTHGGREVWIERASDPVTTDARLKPTLNCPSVEIIRSDEVFNAALVGVGRFGIVYSYVIEVRPQFWVVEVVTKPDRTSVFNALRSGARVAGRPFDDVLALLARDPIPAGPTPQGFDVSSSSVPYFFQLVMTTRNTPGIWAQRRWETRDQTDYNFVSAPNAPGAFFAALFNALQGNTTPSHLVDSIVHGVFDLNFHHSFTQGQRARHAWITAGTPNGQFGDARGVSVEVMFDANNRAYVDFLEEVMIAGGRFLQAGWLSLRPSLATNASLSMHNVAGTHAVSIEIALMQDRPDNEAFLTFIQDRALALGGRLHWGQACNRLNPNVVAAQYGAQLQSWRRALWRVSGDSQVFSNAFTRQRGLEPLRDSGGIAVCSPTQDEIFVMRSGPLQSQSWTVQGGWTAAQARNMAVAQDGGPVAAVSETGRTHVFFIANDGAVVFQRRQASGTWAPFWWFVTTTNLERPWLGVPGGAVHGLSSQPGSVHVLYATASGNIVAVRGDANTGAWQQRDWVRQGRTAPGGWVTGVSRRPGQIDIFTVGLDRRIYTSAWNAQQGWSEWFAIPGITAPPGAPIAAVSRREDFIDIFVADDSGRTMSAAWEPGGQWKGWWHIQNGMTSPGGVVSAVSRSRDMLDIFVVGTDGSIYSAAWNPANGWGGWWSLNNAPAQRVGAPIQAVSRSADMLDIFYFGPSGVLTTMSWAPGRNWSAPASLRNRRIRPVPPRPRPPSP